MSNHVHLIAVPQAEDSLAFALGRVQSEYALALNQGEARSDHVWQGRFFSCPMRRVEHGPLRAKLAASP